jgi:LytR cell envelope-related transcriptional attenuator
MSSVDEQAYRPRMKLRGPITLFVLLALLVGAAWYGAKTVLGQDDKTALSPVCHTEKATGSKRPKLTSKQVNVNVYNAGKTRGLATRIAADLRTRGFVVVKVENAGADVKVAKWEVHAKAKSPQAQLVAEQVKGAAIRTSKTHDSSVDLYLGDDFKKLTAKAPTTITITGSVTVCTTPSPK